MDEPRPSDEFNRPGYDAEEIQRQRLARHRRQLLEGSEDLDHLLEVAERLAGDLNFPVQPLTDYRNALRMRLERIAEDAGTRINRRQRPPQQLSGSEAAARRRSLVFIDECGSHQASDKHFPFFGVGAVVIEEDVYPEVEARWRAWRAEWLANPERATHEPGLRPRSLRHMLAPARQVEEALAGLDALLDSLPLHLVTVVLDHAAFARKYQGKRVDEFLPKSADLMCFTFALERVVHLLYHALGDRIGRVFADQRGRREDALLQREYQRLKVDGTLLLASTWFRYQLWPHVEFKRRGEDVVGLQLADLLVRPVVERYANPAERPTRWGLVQKKIYQGRADTRRAYGLKLFPTNDERLAAMLRVMKNGDQPQLLPAGLDTRPYTQSRA